MTTAPDNATVQSALVAHVSPWTWLALGVLMTALVGNRFNVAMLAWVALVPWLLYLRQAQGWRAWTALFAALQLGHLLQVAKILTAPIPVFIAPMFSVPSAVGAFVVLAAFEALRRRIGDGRGVLAFGALAVLADFATIRGSEMGAWGALANSQIDNLALLQLVSVTGLTGISLLLALSSALVAVILAVPTPRAWWRPALALVTTIAVVHAWGAVRVDTTQSGPLTTVAGIATDVGLIGGVLPDADTLRIANDALFARSEQAVAAGAELVVWNEGATALTREEEPAVLARGQAFAARHGVDLVLAYVVPLDGMRHYENKYVWLTPDGELETYFKHHPVPGEGAVRGTGPLQVHDRPYGHAAGAICYDYDFPGMAIEHGRAGAGLVVVPSSDWRGIDPYHTTMARVRGIEGGFSVVRPVRWATSGAFDAYGRTRATSSWFEGERVLLARIPTAPVATLYSRFGDVLPGLAFIGLIWLSLPALRRRR